MNPRHESLRLRIRKGTLPQSFRPDLDDALLDAREPEELFTDASRAESDEIAELPALTDEDISLT